MIAAPDEFDGRTRDDLLREIDNEIDRELHEASYVVSDDDSALALSLAGLGAVCGTRTTDVLRDAGRAMAQGVPVVLVHATDGALRDYLRENLSGVEIRDVPLPRGVASVAGMLGYTHGDKWDAATAAAKARTWIDLVRGVMVTTHTGTGDVPPTFPVEALPPVLRAIVTEGAAAQGVDVAFWGVPLLGILAGCIGATRRVRITADWREPCVVWAALIAASGAGKSPPLRALLKPVRDHDYELHQRSVVALQQYAADLDAWKASFSDGRRPRPMPPPILAATIDDATMEAVAVRLADNPRGLLAAVDELAGWLNSMDKYRKGGGDEARWLSVHSATSFPIDRKGSASGPARVYVRNPCVSIVGTIQPSIARRNLGSTDRRASGACARMLVAAPRLTAAELTDRAIPTHVHDNYARVIRSLLDLRLDDDGEPVDVPLSETAFSRFRAWHNRNAVACVDAAREGDDDLAAMLSKLRGYAPRIALLLGLAGAAENGTAAIFDVVDDEAMVAAIAIVDYFENEARRIYGTWADDEATERADRERGSLPSLADRIAEILRTGPKAREDLRNATGRNVSAARMDAALAILRANGRATMERAVGPRGGRPREVWTRAEGVSA